MSGLELLAWEAPGWGAALAAGLLKSVLIALGAFSLGLLIGIGGAYGKLYGGPVTRDLLAVYTTIVRAVPELILILILYFAFTSSINNLLLAWGFERIQISGFVAGIAVVALGHADAQLAEVIAKQAHTLITVSNIFYTEPQIELAELLVRHSALDRVFFVNSGAEANESAIKLARKWGNLHKQGAFEIISTNNSFHGRTIAAVSATGTPRYREAGRGGVCSEWRRSDHSKRGGRGSRRRVRVRQVHARATPRRNP